MWQEIHIKSVQILTKVVQFTSTGCYPSGSFLILASQKKVAFWEEILGLGHTGLETGFNCRAATG